MTSLNFAIIGTGGITLQNHLPGLAMCQDVQVTALCDTNPATLEAARQQTGVSTCSTNFEEIVKRDDVHAVIIATPNVAHKPIALAAIANGKHVMCEKPLALTAKDAKEMADAAERAGVRHMTAFTYRFVPAMRYLGHLIKQGDLGQPYHYRSCRLQDWGTRNLGWRQVKALAGNGELGDMLSHRINFAQHLVGPMKRIVANVKTLTPMRGGQPNDTEDWVGIIADFTNGATGVLESSKLASGRNESWRSLDYVEVNGSEATFEFTTGKWDELQHGKLGGPGLAPLKVPREFWTWPGSPRDPSVGDPLVAFRYDQAFEFVDAIRSGRPATPSFHEGAATQAVMDGALESAASGRWIDLVIRKTKKHMKNAVITGAGSGVGRETALALVKQGWRVAILGRRAEALVETAKLAGDDASRVVVLPCDIGDPAAVTLMAERVLQEFGEVEVLVNAAGTNAPNRALEVLSLEDYRAMMDANLHGAYYCVQAFLPAMRARGSGTIVNVVSDAGKQASPKAGPAYVMSKFGMAGLTQSINAEERGRGVRACAIFPGDIDTPLLDKRPIVPDAEARARMMKPEDIAECVVHCINLPSRVVVEEMLVRPR